MFTEVRQSWEGGWVAHVTNMDIQGSGRLVCCLIRDQQNLANITPYVNLIADHVLVWLCVLASFPP